MTLTYLGIRAEQDAAQARRGTRIVELDPTGPAARAGAKVGDVITGWFPARSQPIEVGPEVDTPFTFGLTQFAPGQDGTFFGVLRGEQELKLDVTPREMPGGRRPCLRPGPEFATFLTP